VKRGHNERLLWLDYLVQDCGWTREEAEHFDAAIDERDHSWRFWHTILEENRLGDCEHATVSGWLAVLSRYQVEVLCLFDHPFDPEMRDSTRFAPGTTVTFPIPAPCSLTLPDAPGMQERLDREGGAYMADIVLAWWCALGRDAALGYTSGVTLAEAISHRDAGTLDGLRTLAALRHSIA
jgi:hypothetical protein